MTVKKNQTPAGSQSTVFPECKTHWAAPWWLQMIRKKEFFWKTDIYFNDTLWNWGTQTDWCGSVTVFLWQINYLKHFYHTNCHRAIVLSCLLCCRLYFFFTTEIFTKCDQEGKVRWRSLEANKRQTRENENDKAEDDEDHAMTLPCVWISPSPTKTLCVFWHPANRSVSSLLLFF